MPWGVDETSLPDKIQFTVDSGRFTWLSDVWDDFDPDENNDRLSAELTGAATDYETGETFTETGEWTFRYGICRDTAKNKFEIVEYDPEDEDGISGLVVENPRGKNYNSMSGMGRFVNALMEIVPADDLVDWGMPEDIRTFFGKSFVLENTEFDGPSGPYYLHLPVEVGSAKPAKKKPAPKDDKVAQAKAKLKKASTPEPEEKEAPKPKKKTLRDAVIEMAAQYDDEEEFYGALFDPSEFRGAEKLLENQELQDELPEIFAEHGGG